MEKVEINELTFYYGKTKILNNLNFSIDKGTICGLLGPNGSGKTTLLKCINKLIEPVSGFVKINGKDIKNMKQKDIAKEVSSVPQQINVIFPYRVLDLVVMGKTPYLKDWETPNQEDYEDAMDVLESINIRHLADRKFNELSGGEKQMVLIARAIFQKAYVMLLDEPTAHLDYKNQFLVLDTIKEVSRNKDLIIIITLHDPNLAMHYCDELVMLKKGELISKGKTLDVLHSKNLSEIYDMEICTDLTKGGTSVVIPKKWL